MGESSKFTKSWPSEIQILKLAICLQKLIIFKFKWSIVFRLTENISEKLRYNQPNSAFWGWLSKENQPHNPENFPMYTDKIYWIYLMTDGWTKKQMDKTATICCQFREQNKIYPLFLTENTSWIIQKKPLWFSAPLQKLGILVERRQAITFRWNWVTR